MEPPQSPRKKKTKSELLRLASLQEFVVAHSKPNGQGWKGFFHSNLFTALVLFLLSQSVVVTGLAISYYFKTTALAEWKGETEAVIRRMDRDGTVHSQWKWEEATKERAEMKVRLEKLEDTTKHIEVLESEHRRLTKDVEELRSYHDKK